MMIYHCFARRYANGNVECQIEACLRVLESIVEFGLLCTPEMLDIPPPEGTDNIDKRRLLKAGTPEVSIPQSRFCATLCSRQELVEPKVNGRSLVRGVWAEGPHMAHSSQFGAFAIGFEPIRARSLGFVPTIYYNRNPDPFRTEGSNPSYSTQVGLIQRLKEVRDVLIILAYIEADIEIGNYQLPSRENLIELGIDLPFEEQLLSEIKSLSLANRRKIFNLFDSDRVMSLSLVGSVEVLLNLFQDVDSTMDDSFFSFFEQREWRIVHYMRPGMKWYSLGMRPQFQNPHAENRSEQIKKIRETLGGSAIRDEQYFANTWVLEKIDKHPVAAYIDEVIAPNKAVDEVKQIFLRAGLEPPRVVSTEQLCEMHE